MANTTIYPYGTNGQLPSSIGIINDTTTGGADKALSAEMGKEIGDRLDEIDASLNDVFGGEVSVAVNGNRVTLEIGASASEPRLIINSYATDFMETELNTSKVKHFTLTGRKLTANASISVASSNSAFLLSADGTNYLPTITLNAGSDGKISQVVYVKFTPTNETSYSVTITATCGTASATTTYQGTGAAEVTPSIILQSNLDTITTDAVGNPATLQFVVYGYNLNAPIALSASVDSGSTATLDTNSVSAADAENGKVVTLTFTPGDATDDTITITATSSGATTQTLEITGKVVLPPAVNDIITVDGLYYKVTTAATKQTQGAAKLVKPDGTETSGNSTYTGDITIPASVTYNGYAFAITGFGSYAFYNANVNKVVVGGGITSIGGYQMSYSKTKELVVSDNLTSFGAYSCNGTYLTDLTIGSGLTSIGNGAFDKQTGIKRITIKAATPPSVGSNWPALSGVTLRVPAASVSAYQSATPWSDSSIYTIQAITE